MTEDNQSEEKQEVRPDSAAAMPSTSDSDKGSANPPEEKQTPAASEGPRKILSALDQQSQEEPPSLRPGDAVSVSDQEASPLPSDLLVKDPPDRQEPSDLGHEKTIDSAATFSAIHGPLDPETMISEAMKKLDKILEDINIHSENENDDGPPEK